MQIDASKMHPILRPLLSDETMPIKLASMPSLRRRWCGKRRTTVFIPVLAFMTSPKDGFFHDLDGLE